MSEFVQCPLPLFNTNGKGDNLVTGTPCAFACTGTMLSAEEIDDFYILQLTVSGVSLLLSIFCNITWGMFVVKRKQKVTFWVTFTSVCVSFFVFFPLLISGSGKNAWCVDEVSPRRQSDGISGCVLQGIVLIFFGLSLCCWWWCSCFDLFSKLYRRKRHIEHYLSYYHIISWGLPLLCTLSILLSNNFGFEQPRLWCFISGDAPDFYEYLFFYAWVWLLWFTGTIMFCLTLIPIFSGSKDSNNSNWKKLVVYRVPLMFVVVFSVFWAIFAAFTLFADINAQRFKNSAATWFDCLLSNVSSFPNPAVEASPDAVKLLDPQPDGEQQGCGSVQPGRLSPLLLTLAVLAISGHGILVFLVFFLHRPNFKLWYRYISSGFDPESVRPKNKGRTVDREVQYSSYMEIRRTIAKTFISCCIWFGNLEGVDRKGYLASTMLPNATRNPNYTQEDLEPDNFPRVTYQERTLERRKPPTQHAESNASNDPFPTVPHVMSTDTIGESVLNPGDDFLNSTRHASTANWSDIYDDPLWGVNVDF